METMKETFKDMKKAAGDVKDNLADKASNLKEGAIDKALDLGEKVGLAGGEPVQDIKNSLGGMKAKIEPSLGIGATGPLLLHDLNYQRELAGFTEEGTPPRAAHPKGVGAFGYFSVTNKEISKFTNASVFCNTSSTTACFARLSTSVGEQGSADTFLDLRGFAVRFFASDEANYDLTMLNVPAFMLRDPILFASFNRSRKRNPITGMYENDSYWAYIANRPETTFSQFLIFSDFGMPRNYRRMTGFSINTFKWTGGSGGEDVFVRYHMIPTAPQEISTLKEYLQLSAENPDCFLTDLRDSIKNSDYPSWTLNVQILREGQIPSLGFNPFDPTKVWPITGFPLVEVGVLTLNQNPDSYKEQVEKVAFNPGNLIPGIEISPDRVLQARPFAYRTAHRHRLGPDFEKIAINCPFVKKPAFKNKGGSTPKVTSQTATPHVAVKDDFPIFADQKFESIQSQPLWKLDYSRIDLGDKENFFQLDEYWRSVMTQEEKQRTVNAIAYHLSYATSATQEMTFKNNWEPANEQLASMLREALKLENAERDKDSKTKRV